VAAKVVVEGPVNLKVTVLHTRARTRTHTHTCFSKIFCLSITKCLT